MKYPDSYLLSHDIDWFCMFKGLPIHVASAGGIIPDEINDIDQLRRIQYQVEMLPFIFGEDEIVFNNDGISRVLGNGLESGWEDYIRSFAIMARKGFFSFDRINYNNPFDEEQFLLVCYPHRIIRGFDGVEIPVIENKASLVMALAGVFDVLPQPCQVGAQ